MTAIPTPRADIIAAKWGTDHPLYQQMLDYDRQDHHDAQAVAAHRARHGMTRTEVQAVLDAVRREVHESNVWDEMKDMSLADLCAANQDALIDDLFENYPSDRHRRGEMLLHVATYDTLLGTTRLAEVPAQTGDN